MGFDYTTLLVFPLGLLLPIITLVAFALLKNKKMVKFDTVFYGIGAFLGSIVVAFIIFIIMQTVLVSGFSADNYASGYTLVSIIFSVLIAVIFVCCESFKMVTIKKYADKEEKAFAPSLGFSAGVVIAQSGVFFVALNIFKDATPLFALFTGAFILLSGVMYYVLSYAAEISFTLGSKYAAYAVSAVYYVMWIFMMLFINSPTLIVVIAALFFVISLVLGYAFVKRTKKSGSDR